MRIKVDFTVEVQPEHLPALKELAALDPNAKAERAAEFVRGDAADYVITYLEDNGVPVTLVRVA